MVDQLPSLLWQFWCTHSDPMQWHQQQQSTATIGQWHFVKRSTAVLHCLSLWQPALTHRQVTQRRRPSDDDRVQSITIGRIHPLCSWSVTLRCAVHCWCCCWRWGSFPSRAHLSVCLTMLTGRLMVPHHQWRLLYLLASSTRQCCHRNAPKHELTASSPVGRESSLSLSLARHVLSTRWFVLPFTTNSGTVAAAARYHYH